MEKDSYVQTQTPPRVSVSLVTTFIQTSFYNLNNFTLVMFHFMTTTVINGKTSWLT